MTFEHLKTIFHYVKGKHKQPFTFWYCVDKFYPWKDIVGKKVSKLKPIAELWAFHGIFSICMTGEVVVQVWMVSSEESSVVRLAQAYRRSLAAQQPPQISVVEALDGAEVTLFFAMLRIRDVYPGYRIRISNPGS
jgi:hypothetical protein